MEKITRLLIAAGALLLIAGTIFGFLKRWIHMALVVAGAFGCLAAALNFTNQKDK